MNIVMFLSEYFPPKRMNANHNRVYYLAKGLSKSSNVIIICPNNTFKYGVFSLDGIKIFRFPYSNSKIFGKFHMMLSAPKYVRNILAKENLIPDILWYNSVLSFNISRSFSCTKIYDVMGINSLELSLEKNWYNNSKSFLYNIFENILYKNSDIIITINEAHKRILSKKFKGEIYVIRDAVSKKPEINAQLYNSLRRKYKDEFVLFFVGSFNRRRFDKIIDSFKELFESLGNLRIVVAGEGKHLEYYKNRFEEMGIGKNFDFLGHVGGKDLNSYIKMSDVCVSDVFLEGFPYKIFEYMSMGKTLLIEDTSGVREVIKNGSNGLLYKNAREFKNNVIMLANDSALRKKLGSQSLKDIKFHTWDVRRRQFDKILSEVRR